MQSDESVDRVSNSDQSDWQGQDLSGMQEKRHNSVVRVRDGHNGNEAAEPKRNQVLRSVQGGEAAGSAGTQLPEPEKKEKHRRHDDAGHFEYPVDEDSEMTLTWWQAVIVVLTVAAILIVTVGLNGD